MARPIGNITYFYNLGKIEAHAPNQRIGVLLQPASASQRDATDSIGRRQNSEHKKRDPKVPFKYFKLLNQT